MALVDVELEDADVEDVAPVEAELPDVELAEEPEETLPVFDATKPVWVPVAP